MIEIKYRGRDRGVEGERAGQNGQPRRGKKREMSGKKNINFPQFLPFSVPPLILTKPEGEHDGEEWIDDG